MLAVVLFTGVVAADPVEIDVEDLDGEGTEGDPYIVTNASELQAIQGDLTAHYKLGNDIDANETQTWDGGSGFDPIGNSSQRFTGHFNGSGYTISDLYIDRNSEDHVGLFGYVDTDGTIEKVGLESISVNGYWHVGGLVGVNRDGGTVSESYTTGSVNGSTIVGGLVGHNYGGTVSESYAIGSVEGSSNVGGLVGFNHVGEVHESYATGSVEGTDTAGGLVGYKLGGTVSKSYWDRERSGESSSDGGFGLTTQEMQGSWSEGNMTEFNFSDTWSTVAGDYPDLQNNSRKTSTPHFEKPDADEQARILADMETDEGVKLVTSDKALQAINRNSTTRGWDYRLVIDIDASGTDQWDSGSGFEPIRTFTGTFDGNEHTISTLYIDRGGESEVGLFGETGTSSSIENVRLQNPTVTGGKDTGPLVGAFQGSMSRSAVDGGTVTTEASGEAHLGGLVGVLYDYATIELSMTSATVDANGKDEVGGLAGDMAGSGAVKRSYATGDVLNGGDTIGGLLGDANSGSDIIESFAAGHVEGGSEVGGLLGRVDGGSPVNVERSYWDTDATGQEDSAGDGTGLSTGEMTGLNATVEMFGFDFDDTWRPGDDDYPDLAWDSEFETSADILTGDGDTDNPYEITTVYELQAMNYNLGANYTLANDIDAQRTDEWFEDGGTPQGFDPIGDWGDRFTGTFNGSGHTISDLYIDRSSENYVGLFGVVDTDVTIEKIGLEEASVDGDNRVGGLVGQNDGEVRESYATGSVNGAGSEVGGLVGENGNYVTESYATGSVDGSSWNVGGLVGQNNGGTVSESYATGSVEGDWNVGGLIGGNLGSGTVSESYATGSVEGSGSVGGLVGSNDGSGTIHESYATGSVEGSENYVGGLVGSIWGGTVSESYAIGSVKGSDDYVGGIVGWNDGEVRESYATNDVNGSGNLNVGGLVGYNDGDGTVNQSYATGSVKGFNTVGGLVGYNNDGGTVSESYASGSVNGSEGNVGGLVGYNNGEVIESYATGSVKAPIQNGGLVGNDNGDVVDSYWDTESTNQPTSAGGATGLTTAQMTGINATESENMGALDFTSTWAAVDSYPLLTWSISDLDLTLAEDSVTAGESTDATVTLTLADSTTPTATTTSDYSSDETSVATVDAGTVTTASPGSTTLTAELREFTDTATISVAAAPASPGSGGSSGSASSSPTPPLEISVSEDTTVVATNARAGDIVRIAPETTGSPDSLGERGSVGVDSISVELTTDRDFWMVVDTFERGSTGPGGTDGQADDEELSETRSTISTAFETETSTLSAGYVTVTHNLEPEDVSNVTFEFSVQKERLEADELTPESITLHRQSDGWAPLPTEYLETNDTEVRFEATSPGFSSFAIGTGEPLTRMTGATLAESELIEGDIALVTVFVENRGEIDAEHSVKLTADGVTVATETLVLGPGETDETTLSFEPSAGEYDLAVDGTHVDSLAVTEAPATDSPDDDPAIDDESITTGVGYYLIGVLLIIVAVGSALVVMLRRKGYQWSDLSSKL